MTEYMVGHVLFETEWEEKTGIVSGFVIFLNKIPNGGNVELNRITVRDGIIREGGFY